MPKSAADVRADLAAHLDFLAEAGAGFVLRGAGATGAAGPAAAPAAAPIVSPAAAGLPSLAGAPPQSPAERAALEEIDRQVLACVRCPLHKLRTKAVPGEGDRRAAVMFIGEAPGRDEDAQGRPFVGRAGQLLRKIIAAMKYREDEVYITNIVKCAPYLVRQIELIRPRVIVTLGKTPTDYFAPGRESMTSRRGRFADYRGIPVMPTFHPSYLVRNEGNRELKRMVWEDMQKVMALVGKA
ncbi:MAG: uracil-DNA glycosylase [Acidobacteria bacterium]|nr:uracil-DNA glycosylase [Acidobacteriota bacterium]